MKQVTFTVRNLQAQWDGLSEIRDLFAVGCFADPKGTEVPSLRTTDI